MSSPERLLLREGLAPEHRLLVGAAAAVQRGDRDAMRAWFASAKAGGRPRQDLEETLLQCVLFCGFPRVVGAFGELATIWPAATPPRGGALPPDQQAPAGRALFAAIYGRNDGRVRQMLAEHHGELHDFVLEAAYGRILTRPHLPAATRELLAVALLAAQQQQPQFRGHARGAVSLGVSAAALREAVVTAFDGDERAAAPWLAQLD